MEEKNNTNLVNLKRRFNNEDESNTQEVSVITPSDNFQLSPECAISLILTSKSIIFLCYVVIFVA